MIPRILLLTILLLCSILLAQTTRCTEEQVCSANCDGKSIDIANLYNKLSIEDDRKYRYFFSCNGDPCGINNVSTAICQRAADGGKSYSCGVWNTSVWTIVSTEPLLILNVNYTEGDALGKKPRTSSVNITVDPLFEGDATLFNGEDHGNYMFNFTVHSLSPKSHKSPTEGYVGWILIVVSFIGFLSYLTIGSIVLYFKKGARGIEIIPNLSFWKSFPLLLKDGFLLTISPCYLCYKRGYNKV